MGLERLSAAVVGTTAGFDLTEAFMNSPALRLALAYPTAFEIFPMTCGRIR